MAFEWGLVDSTTFKSRVMWPLALRDQPLFEYREPAPSTRLRAWLRKIGLKPNTNVQSVAETVRQFVAGKASYAAVASEGLPR